jgi:hypothetical protein
MTEPVTSAVTESVEGLGAMKALGIATGRISFLLGLDVNAATRQAPEVALAILGTEPRVIVIRAATRLTAIQQATRFLDAISDGVERRWSQRLPPGVRVQEPKVLPNLRSHPGSVLKIGGVKIGNSGSW